MTEYFLPIALFVVGLAAMTALILFDDHFTRTKQVSLSIIGLTMLIFAFLV